MPNVAPNKEFSWKLTVGCSQVVDQCINATVTDKIPDGLEIVKGSVTSSRMSDVTVNGQNVKVVFKEDIISSTGGTGLKTNAEVLIPVKLTTNDPAQTGKIFANTATVVADNAVQKESSMSVKAVIPETLAATGTKKFTPNSLPGRENAATSAALTVTNKSNVPVNNLTIQDPANLSSNVFEQYLAVDSFGSVTWPAGATRAIVSVSKDKSTWINGTAIASGQNLTLPAGVAATDVRAVRVSFQSDTATIPVDAAATVNLGMKARPAASGISASTKVTNDASMSSGAAAGTSDLVTVSDVLTFTPATLSLSTSKVFSPRTITMTGKTTAQLVATNTGSVPLSSMTIAEPTDVDSANNSLSPLYSQGGMTFTGYGSNINWPVGATKAETTYYYSDKTNNTVSTTTSNQLAAPTSGKRVIGFKTVFTGSMKTGAVARIPVELMAPTLTTVETLVAPNEISVSGVAEDNAAVAPVTASDSVTVANDRISVAVKKSMSKSEVWALPNQNTAAMLTATLGKLPETTIAAKQLIIDDPDERTGLTSWYDYFNASAISVTQIPSNTLLTVQYRDRNGSFATIPGMENVSGAADGVYTAAIPANIQDQAYGIRFIYNSTTGMNAGQVFAANINYSTRSTIRSTGAALPLTGADGSGFVATLENCAAAQGSNGSVVSNRAVVTNCPKVKIRDWDWDGDVLKVKKDWTPSLIAAGTIDRTKAELTWDLNNVQGIDSVVLTDPNVGASGVPGDVKKSSFDAFDLESIGPISDPQMKYDQLAVEIFNSVSNKWEPASKCTPANPCTGASIGTISLSATESARTTAVRLTVTEAPNRDIMSASGPTKGSGVSAGNGRKIPLQMSLRSTLRSDSSVPVKPTTVFNTDTAGMVENTTLMSLTMGGNTIGTDSSSDTIQISDVVLNVSADTNWGPTPMSIPKNWDGSNPPVAMLQMGGVNLTSDEAITPGDFSKSQIHTLSLYIGGKDNAGNYDPFEYFNFTGISDLAVPAGTSRIEIALGSTGAAIPTISGATKTEVLAAVNALDAEAKARVNGVTVSYKGQIVKGSTFGRARASVDMELRPTKRTSGAPTPPSSPSWVTYARSYAKVTSSRFNGTENVDESKSAENYASIEFRDQDLTVSGSAAFSPDTHKEPDSKGHVIESQATATGTDVVGDMMLTYDNAALVNEYDLKSILSASGPRFNNTEDAVMRLSYCTGRTLTADAIAAKPNATCEETGGTWSNWTAFEDPFSIADKQFDTTIDVQGVRIQFARANAAGWSGITSGNGSRVQARVKADRRDTLRTGGVNPSTLSTGTPAPGESAVGETTAVIGLSAKSTSGLAGTNTAKAKGTYVGAVPTLAVKKDPSGDRAPGQTYPYTLTFQNTGQIDIIDPVVVDSLPWDPTIGTLLRFDQDISNAPRYTYSLAGTNPSSGTPLPTDPAAVSVTEDLTSSTPSLKFTFPAGSRLAAGQTYTISFDMKFAPGVLAGQEISNTFSVTGDRAWGACTALPGGTANASPDNLQCSGSSIVRPTNAGSSWGVKSVRPLDNVGSPSNTLGFHSERPGVSEAECATRANGDAGYSQFPCSPRTNANQKEEWRINVVNDGTANTDKLVVADYLPVKGDSTLVAGLNRNSAWSPVFTGEAPKLGAGSGHTLTTYESNASQANLCMSGISDPTMLDSCLDATGTDASKWVPLGTYAPKDVTALLFVVDGTLVPGQAVPVTFTTTTAGSGTIAPDAVAFNSLTVSSLWTRNGQVTRVTARDQSLVGVARAESLGAVKIHKTVTGAGAAFVPSDQMFSGNLLCTSEGVDLPKQPFTVKNGATIQIDGLPADASCTVEESSDTKQSSYTATRVIANADTVPTIELVNTYDTTSLSVAKAVDSAAGVVPGGFGFGVECAFLGAPIDLGADGAFTLDAGGVKTISGLPVNANCTVTETNAKGASSTGVVAKSVNADQSVYGSVSVDNVKREAKLSALAPASGVNRVDMTNSFSDMASLQITKERVGGAAYVGADRAFDVNAVCTFQGTEVINTQVSLSKANGWSQTIPNVLGGSSCVVTEPDLNGASSVVVSPNNGVDLTRGVVSVPAGATGPVDVTVSNRFLGGSLHVDKQVVGDGAGFGTADFTVELVCELDGVGVAIPGGATRTVSASVPGADYTGLPSGADCTVKETNAGGASSSSIRQGSGAWVNASDGVSFTVATDAGVAGNGDQAQTGIELRNQFDTTSVSITKQVDSSAVDAKGKPVNYGPFEVGIECSFMGKPVDLTHAKKNINDGETVTWNGLPVGADCEVKETNSRGAVDVQFTGKDAGFTATGEAWILQNLQAVSVSITNSATVTNTFDAGKILVTKVVTGSGADEAKGKTFTAAVECSVTDAAHPDGLNVWSGKVSLKASSGWKAEIPGVAAGATCTVTETETGGAESTTYAVDGKTSQPKGVEFSVTKGQTNEVTITNSFKKTVVPPTVRPGGKLPFTGLDSRVLGGIVLLLLVSGGAAIVVARRKRENEN